MHDSLVKQSISKSIKCTSLIVFISLIFFNLFPVSAHAGYESYRGYCGECWWHPIVSLGGGYLASTEMGQSQTFPIQNPITDEFFIYSANHGTATRGFFDAFVGVEFPSWMSFGTILQLGLGYSQTAPFTVKGTLTQGADVFSQDVFNYQYNVTLYQLLVEAKLLATFATVFHPYVFAGVGVAFNKANDFETNVPPFLTFTRMYANNTTDFFSYSLGFGIDYDLDALFRVGVGYRFSSYGHVNLGNAVIDTTPVPGTLSQDHLYTNEIIGQITFVLS